jgi:predicted nucleic acid-binding protein
MRLVVADTGPLNYLVLIGAIELLPKLFEKVFAATAVHSELLDPDAPPMVRAWAEQPPSWLEVQSVPAPLNDPAWRALDAGEREALSLARALNAELVLMDDRAAVAVAQRQGFTVTGTLGVLDLAAQRGLSISPTRSPACGRRVSAAGRESWTPFCRATIRETADDGGPRRPHPHPFGNRLSAALQLARRCCP